MATTIPKLSRAELEGHLRELLALSERHALIAHDIRAKVEQLENADLPDGMPYLNGVAGALKGIYHVARGETIGDEGFDSEELADEIRDALTVLALVPGDWR